jgi:hypothetical protein
MQIGFAQSVTDVAGYFTYAEPVSIQAFDASHTLLGSSSSSFSSNMAVSGVPGSSPNEFLQLPFSNISYVTFTDDPAGGSFTVDNLTYTSAGSPAPVREPGTFGLMLLGAAGLVRGRGRRHTSFVGRKRKPSSN